MNWYRSNQMKMGFLKSLENCDCQCLYHTYKKRQIKRWHLETKINKHIKHNIKNRSTQNGLCQPFNPMSFNIRL